MQNIPPKEICYMLKQYTVFKNEDKMDLNTF